jgi:hypothetical protein
MDIRKQFEYNPTIDLTAAHIGINRWDWDTIDEENEEKAKEFMRGRKYDVLPIRDKNGKIEKFFSTRDWNNYDKLNLSYIAKSNLIYYRMSLSDLIRKFNEDKTHFYFLTNNKDVLGLVSLVNLNCQAVYNFLFQVISDLERSIAYLLKAHIDQGELLNHFKSSSDDHLTSLVTTFESSAKPGKENTIFEHMYLQTVGITLKQYFKILPDRYKQLNKFSHKFSADNIYGQLRNKIMHPVRPILNDTESISQMDELLRDYSEIKEILR